MSRVKWGGVRQVWAWPLIVAVCSIVGLLAALLGDGWADVLSWLALALPVVIALWYSLAPGRTALSSRS